MKYDIRDAADSDINYLKEVKANTVFSYATNLTDSEKERINSYIDRQILLEIKNYKIIMSNDKIIGCYLVTKKDNDILIDEIFIEESYRDKGIGTNIINAILKDYNIVYLWVYKENVKAISLYKKLGFEVVEETQTRYYMIHTN